MGTLIGSILLGGIVLFLATSISTFKKMDHDRKHHIKH